MMNIEQIIKGFERTHITMDLRRYADNTYMADLTADKFNTYRSGWVDGQAALAAVPAQDRVTEVGRTMPAQEPIEKLKELYEKNLAEMLGMDFVFDDSPTYKDHLKEAFFRCFCFGHKAKLESKKGDNHAI